MRCADKGVVDDILASKNLPIMIDSEWRRSPAVLSPTLSPSSLISATLRKSPAMSGGDGEVKLDTEGVENGHGDDINEELAAIEDYQCGYLYHIKTHFEKGEETLCR